jgi:hypothetical protein
VRDDQQRDPRAIVDQGGHARRVEDRDDLQVEVGPGEAVAGEGEVGPGLARCGELDAVGSGECDPHVAHKHCQPPLVITYIVAMEACAVEGAGAPDRPTG